MADSVRLIDADALLSKVMTVGIVDGNGNYCGAGDVVLKEEIDAAPTIDPVKHGIWVGEGDGYADGEMVYDRWYCDQCNHCEETDDPNTLPHYCPDCGALMEV